MDRVPLLPVKDVTKCHLWMDVLIVKNKVMVLFVQNVIKITTYQKWATQLYVNHVLNGVNLVQDAILLKDVRNVEKDSGISRVYALGVGGERMN